VASGKSAILGVHSFDLTRDGFTLLAMDWTGEKAMASRPPNPDAQRHDHVPRDIDAISHAPNPACPKSGRPLVPSDADVIADGSAVGPQKIGPCRRDRELAGRQLKSLVSAVGFEPTTR
jgi:hypothetical protein